MGTILVSETYLSQLYNREVKEAFLRDMLEDEGTREAYAINLIKASEWEKRINKDVYEFSRAEALDMFSNSYTSSYSTLRVFYSICKQYGSWATVRGYNKTGVNPIELINFKQHIMPMLNIKGLKNRFLTEEQVWEFQDMSKNYQDTVCLIPVFYGIKGSRCAELINLKEDDIDIFNNTLKLTDNDGSIREVKISNELMDVFKKAQEQGVYNRRGEVGFGNKTTVDLVSSDYVIRPVVSKRAENFSSAPNISTRCKKLLDEAGFLEMSIQDVYLSGKLHRLRKIEQAKGYIEVEDYKDVNRSFGDSIENYSNLRELYNSVNAKMD